MGAYIYFTAFSQVFSNYCTAILYTNQNMVSLKNGVILTHVEEGFNVLKSTLVTSAKCQKRDKHAHKKNPGLG